MLALSLLTSFSAIAQEEGKGDFSSHKAKIIANLNQEKAIIDQTITCINSATTREDAKNCHEQRKANMEKLRGERKEWMEKFKEKKEQKMDRKSGELNNPNSSTTK